MTIKEALLEGRGQLQHQESPYLEALLLLGKVLKTTKEKLMASGPDPLSTEDFSRFQQLLLRRIQGEPVSYILGEREFFGLMLKTDHRALDPRPDTEILVEAGLTLMKENTGRILDLCTGTGCIALAVKSQKPEWEVWGSDLSPEALELARENGEALDLQVKFHQSDLLNDIPGPFDLILTNPPYLTPEETAQRSQQGWVEPPMALDGKGEDGLELIRKIIKQAIVTLSTKGYLLIEAAPWQSPAIQELLKEAGFTAIQCWQDLSGQTRVTGGRRI